MIAARLLSAALATAAVAATAPAGAETLGRTRSVTVRTADLDLATVSGAAELHRRVVKAARKICGTSDALDLQAQPDVLACRVDTIARSTPQAEMAVSAARSASAGAQLASAAPRSTVAVP